MKRIALVAALVAVVGTLAPAPARAAGLEGMDWNALMRALRSAFSAWRLFPKPPPTATRPPTVTATSTRTATRTRTPVPTSTPTRTVDPEQEGQIAFGVAPGIPPAQKLASALIVFPFIRSTVEIGGTEDTRIMLVNMSRNEQELQCFYVRQSDCNEIGFYVTLTAEQPLSWLVSEGTSNPANFTNVPPFDGTGELKCAVISNRAELSAHNILQGRALVFDTAGETVGYGAIGFQKLSPGSFSGVIELDGFTYEQCPERLHFQTLATNAVSSDMVLIPCSQDLLLQTMTQTAVQLQIVNEFEQVFSSSFLFKCHTGTKALSSFSTLRYSLLGTDTAHVVIRGVSVPLLGLVIDRFDALGQRQTTVNEPFLEGGASATVVFP